MHKRNALRLKAGDRIGFGHSMWAADIEWADSYQVATVVHVTPRGGIKVRLRGRERWVPYHHVWHVRRKAVTRSAPSRSLKPWEVDGL